MRYFYSREKAINKFITESLGFTERDLDLDKFADHVLGTVDMGTRGIGIYSKLIEGELSPSELGQILIECTQ